MKYMAGLVGWTGYSKSELLDGKYRPLFGKLKLYSSVEGAKRAEGGISGWNPQAKAIVKATKANVLKHIAFTEKYASYDDNSKKQMRLYALNKIGETKVKAYFRDTFKDRMIQAKKPGKRKSRKGNVYWESRPNRSDQGKWI